VVEVDLATGERSSFGGTFVGVGAVLEKLFDLTPSLDGRVLAPVDFNGDRGILTVDPETGTRQVVSAQGVGVGDEFGTILSVDIDPQSTELLVVDVSDRLFVVDPQSGARQVVLDSSDPDVGGIRGACWLPGSNLRALVLDDVLDRVAVFNRLTGSVTPLASGLSGASGLVVDPVGNRALVAAGDRLFAIDLDSGDATTVTRKNDSVGGGEPFDSLGALAVDPERGVAYARDDILETVLSIDLTTGQRSLVASGFVGDGLALQGNGGLSLSDDGKTLFAFHEFASAILAITIETGDRLLVSR
jgi:DNA-binding beta-propeller fold protein YncE